MVVVVEFAEDTHFTLFCWFTLFYWFYLLILLLFHTFTVSRFHGSLDSRVTFHWFRADFALTAR